MNCNEFTECIIPTFKHLCKKFLPRSSTKKKILHSINNASYNEGNFLMPPKNNVSLLLAATSLFFGVDIVFTKFIYNQSLPITTQLDSLQNSSETLHICAFENESDEWVFFPMVLPSSISGYFKNLVSIFIFFILALVYFYVQGLSTRKSGCLCRLH